MVENGADYRTPACRCRQRRFGPSIQCHNPMLAQQFGLDRAARPGCSVFDL